MPEPAQRPSDQRVQGWAVVRTAPDQLTAEVWRGLLESEAIPATLAPGDAVSFLGVSPVPCRLLVPEPLLAAAERVLADELGIGEEDQESVP
jgi:hypothetical protein